MYCVHFSKCIAVLFLPKSHATSLLFSFMQNVLRIAANLFHSFFQVYSLGNFAKSHATSFLFIVTKNIKEI